MTVTALPTSLPRNRYFNEAAMVTSQPPVMKISDDEKFGQILGQGLVPVIHSKPSLIRDSLDHDLYQPFLVR